MYTVDKRFYTRETLFSSSKILKLITYDAIVFIYVFFLSYVSVQN